MGYSDMTGRPIREMTYEEKRQQRNLIIRQANDIGNIVKCLILGPVSAEGYEPWAQLLRKQIEAYRVGGSLRAMDGGADILETLDRLLASHERVIARMKEQTPSADLPEDTPRQPEIERVAFKSAPDDLRPGFLRILVPDVGVFLVMPGVDRAERLDGSAIHIKWCETMPPKPIDVWLQRPRQGGK